jgi:YegS/Rv2252/BmrU family lipid kinase
MSEKKNKPSPDHWFVIVNPNSGNKKIGKDWKKIEEYLFRQGIHFIAVFTERKGHAFELSKKYILEGGKKIIIAGGDGTFNEVVNGVFSQDKFPTSEITLALILAGTGNDWGRMYGIPEDYKQAVKTIREGRTFLQDAGKVSYHHDDKEEIRYFANMAGMGYDALVAHKTNKFKERGRGGALSYFYNLLAGLFEYRQKNIEVWIDGANVYSGKVFSMSIGICSYNGGGMKQLPNAIPDDGLLDITLIKETSKMEVVRNIKKLYDGSFINLHMIEVFTGKTVTVQTIPGHSVYLETDGESLGQSPMHFEIIPRSIRLVIPKQYRTP